MEKKINSLCLSGMIIDLVSFFIDFVGLVSATGLVLSIVGLTQVKGKDDSKSRTFAIVGIICAGIELVLKIIQLFGLFAISLY